MPKSALAVLALAPALLAQPQPSRPAYEVASIKPNTTGSNNSSSNGSRGQILFTNQTLQRFIERAFSVKTMQVVGPPWLQDLRFDIAAKYPDQTKPEDRMLMLRTLLEDRFKLAIHHETRELPGYILVVAKGGFKLKPVDASAGSDTNGTGSRVRELKASHASITQLVDLLSRYLNEFVVDKTELTGAYDFQLKWVSEDTSPGPDTEGVPTLPEAVQEVMGLKLQRQKVPVDMIIVDHMEKSPVDQ